MKRTKEEMQARLDKMIEARHMLIERLVENDALEKYREYMICTILNLQKDNRYTFDDLSKMSTIQLEEIYEHTD